jgi:hypothetical protein
LILEDKDVPRPQEATIDGFPVVAYLATPGALEDDAAGTGTELKLLAREARSRERRLLFERSATVTEEPYTRRDVVRRGPSASEDQGRALGSDERDLTDPLRFVERPRDDERVSLFNLLVTVRRGEPPCTRDRRANRRI